MYSLPPLKSTQTVLDDDCTVELKRFFDLWNILEALQDQLEVKGFKLFMFAVSWWEFQCVQPLWVIIHEIVHHFVRKKRKTRLLV